MRIINKNKTPNQLSKSEIDEALKKTVYKSVTKGVYAGEYQGIKMYRVVDSEVDWVAYSFNLSDGRTINIKVPQGSLPPTQQDAEFLSTKQR